MDKAPTRDERRRVEAVLDAAAGSPSLLGFLQATLAALDEHLRYATCAFMLALADEGSVGERAYAGTTHGYADCVLEEYFERWANRDPLASRASRASFHGTGRTQIREIYARLDEPRRLFVDDFCRRNRNQQQLSLRLACGWTDGYLTLLGAEEYTERDERIAGELAPPIAELLRSAYRAASTSVSRGARGRLPSSSRSASATARSPACSASKRTR